MDSDPPLLFLECDSFKCVHVFEAVSKERGSEGEGGGVYHCEIWIEVADRRFRLKMYAILYA